MFLGGEGEVDQQAGVAHLSSTTLTQTQKANLLQILYVMYIDIS